MRLLEYQSKKILADNKIPVPKGIVLSEPKENIHIAPPAIIKAQIPLGGRKKAGGILECADKKQMEKGIKSMLSSTVRGHKVKKVLVEKKVEIAREFYLGIIYDTVEKLPVAVFSTRGGIDVEEVSREDPSLIGKRHFSPIKGLAEFEARELISSMGITGKTLLGLSNILSVLSTIFLIYDATVAEINPLAETKDSRRIALDCHMEIDDDALFRHPLLKQMAEDGQEGLTGRTATDFEKRAAKIDALDQRGVAGRLIEFDGDLGLIIGGGGASLTAFDAIQRYGGRPANYCEIGGNPSVLKTKELTKLILSKPGVEKIAVIMNVVSNTRVDLMARGVIKGVLEMGKDPSETIAIFRVPGAWEEEGFKILSKYGVEFCDRAVSIDEAARRAVEKLRN